MESSRSGDFTFFPRDPDRLSASEKTAVSTRSNFVTGCGTGETREGQPEMVDFRPFGIISRTRIHLFGF